jgi:Domain of unknown function (DUF4280)
MPLQVCTGASMKCSFGAAPSSFVATTRPVSTSNMTAGVINDNIPINNIPPFGTCNSLSNPQVAAATSAALGVLTPQPCVPVIPSPWKPGAAKVMIVNILALDNVSTLNCAWGGVITFASAGQTSHQIP